MKTIKLAEQYTDLEVIERIVEGETALFEILIRRYNPFLYKTGRSYNYNHEDTQDLMQETFIQAFLYLSKFENRSSFKTWLIRIMLNNCFQNQRKSVFKTRSSMEINDNDLPMFTNAGPSDTYKNVVARELRSVIETALLHVPEDYRLVFSLREISGLNVAETAEALSITEANVKVRLNRAKTMLRKEIEKSYSPDEIFEFNLVHCDAIVKNVMDEISRLTQ